MDELISRIRQSKKISLIAHINPDGDAVGSLLGLTLGLQSLEKTVFPVLHDPVPPVFASFLPESEQVANTLPEVTDVDLCIVLDASESMRTGFADSIQEYGKQGKLGFVDHHPLGDLARLTQAYFHSLEASSCAELVLSLLQALEVRITPRIATCLLVGLYTDTGGFQHANTSPQALEAAAELLRRGARLQAITQALEESKSLAGLRLLGLALERVRLNNSKKYTTSILAHSDFNTLRANGEDLPGIVGEISNLPGTNFTLFLSEADEGTIRGMLRTSSQSNFSVNQLARLLGGGGHPRASGFSVKGSLVLEENGWQIV